MSNYMINAGRAVLFILYKIMYFSYASKNSVDTSKVSATISKANMHLSMLSRKNK